MRLSELSATLQFYLFKQFRVAQLFSSQMETQRLFFEEKLKEVKDRHAALEKSSGIQVCSFLFCIRSLYLDSRT